MDMLVALLLFRIVLLIAFRVLKSAFDEGTGSEGGTGQLSNSKGKKMASKGG
jgi:type II secretory pathway component PulJ